MKKGTRIHNAGLGSGSSFFFCFTAEERDILNKTQWRYKNSKKCDDQYFDRPQQTCI